MVDNIKVIVTIVLLVVLITSFVALLSTHDRYQYDAKCTEVPMWRVKDVSKLGTAMEHFYIHMSPEEAIEHCEVK